jgi:hypothetical protein
MPKPSDYPDVHSYLAAIEQEKIDRHIALLEDAFLRGWCRVHSLDEYFLAQETGELDVFTPYVQSVWQAEVAGFRAAKARTARLHSNGAA